MRQAFPACIQAANDDALCAIGADVSVTVTDNKSLVNAFDALARVYRHVIVFDVDGNVARIYDNR